MGGAARNRCRPRELLESRKSDNCYESVNPEIKIPEAIRIPKCFFDSIDLYDRLSQCKKGRETLCNTNQHLVLDPAEVADLFEWEATLDSVLRAIAANHPPKSGGRELHRRLNSTCGAIAPGQICS